GRAGFSSLFSRFLGPARPVRQAGADTDGDAGAGGEYPVAVRDLRIAYLPDLEPLEVIRGVNLAAVSGRTLAIVGESGSGKSTLLRAVATPLPMQARITGGSAVVAGAALANLSHEQVRDLRRRKIGVVFQDAASALNPVMTVGQQLLEAIGEGRSIDGQEARRKAVSLLEAVGISDPV